ncbi:hypothetical protein D3C78_1895890 [compost metagenome]
MQKIRFWAQRTLRVVGQIPAALALAAFVVVWAKVGHISLALAYLLLVALAAAVICVQLMKAADRKKAKLEEHGRIGTGLR